VENAAEALASSDVETGHLVRIDDRCGQLVQRACIRDALVWAVSVVELFERRRCVVGSMDVLNPCRVGGQIAWASSVNAAATRVAGGASRLSS
jgi:hypothetical protein